MAKRLASYKKTVIDPTIAIPLGAEDEFEHDLTSFAISDELEDNTSIDISEDFVIEESDDPGILTPESVTIISQKIRRAPGGQNVVDLIIEVGDLEGAITYEMRIVKV